MDTTQIKLCQLLNTILFDKVWSEPQSEYRDNILPTRLYTRSRTGSIQLRNESIQLPTLGDPYFIFSIHSTSFHGICPYAEEWMSVSELNTNTKLCLNIHGPNGEMICKDFAYILNSPARQHIILAINKDTMRKTLNSFNDNVYVAVYFDSDLENDKRVWCKLIRSQSDINTFGSKRNTSTYDYVNGRSVHKTTPTSSLVKYGDYVECVTDENIVDTFEIDLTKDDENRYFISTMDSCSKQIIHIPKSINNDNEVIVHNTCDIQVFGKFDNKPYYGYYLHRCQSGVPIKQITHNDFSIPSYILEAYKSKLGSEALILKVYVRKHNKDNYLIRDKSYIDLLYSHDDNDILDFLEGDRVDQIDFWSAAELEQSKFIHMLKDTPNFVTETSLNDAIDALGYFHVLSLVSDRIFRSVVADRFAGVMVVNKPYILQDKKVKPIVYIGGYKLKNSQFTVNDLGTYLTISLSQDVTYSIGDSIMVEMLTDGNGDIYTFIPSAETQSITVPYEYPIIHKVITSSSPVNGIENEYNTKFERVPNDYGPIQITYDPITNSSNILFHSTLFENTYVIQDGDVSIEKSIDLTLPINHNELLVFDLYGFNTDSTMTVPLHNAMNSLVYLNGSYLVKDVDFKIYEIKDETGLYVHQLVIQNTSYIKSTNNYLDIIIHPDIEIDNEYGYLTKNDHIENSDLTDMWYENISTVFIEGTIVKDINSSGDRLNILNPIYRIGAIYNSRTVIPKGIATYIDTFYSNEDKERLDIINNYFNTINKESVGEIIIIPYSHKIYSIYLHSIIVDILNDNLTTYIGLDPELNTIVGVDKYEYLKQYDLVFNKEQNLNYIDINPSYKQQTTSDPTKYKLIQLLMSNVLPEDKVLDGESYL